MKRIVLAYRTECMTFCISCKKTTYPAHTKNNVVRGTVIYSVHIKFELGRKHCMYSSMLLII